VNSQAFEQNRPSHGGTGALGIKAHFLALKVGERLDLRASENMELAYVQFGNVADPLIDILDLPRSLILVQDVRVGDGNIDATQIQHVVHVLGSPVTDNWEDSKIVAVIERLGEFGRKTNERTFQQPSGYADGPIIRSRDLEGFTRGRGGWRAALGCGAVGSGSLRAAAGRTSISIATNGSSSLVDAFLLVSSSRLARPMCP